MDYLSNARIAASKLAKYLELCNESYVKDYALKTYRVIVIPSMATLCFLMASVDRMDEYTSKIALLIYLVVNTLAIYICNVYNRRHNMNYRLMSIGCIGLHTKDTNELIKGNGIILGDVIKTKDYLFLGSEQAKLAIDISNRLNKATAIELQFLMYANLFMGKYARNIDIDKKDRDSYLKTIKAIESTYETIVNMELPKYKVDSTSIKYIRADIVDKYKKHKINRGKATVRVHKIMEK